MRESKKKSTHFTSAHIDKIKDRIKSGLREIQEKDGIDARLTAITVALDSLKDQNDDDSLLERFIYVMFALIHHARYGGLPSKTIADLIELAQGLLALCKIQPGESRLSYLYTELYTIVSQINLQNGYPLRAAWEQQLAGHLSRTSEGYEGISSLSLAICNLKLGNAASCISLIDEACTDSKFDARNLAQAKLLKLKSLRLSGKLSEAVELQKQLDTQLLGDSLITAELEWETVLRNATKTGDLAEVVSKTLKGKTHWSAAYVSEAVMWIYAHQKTNWLERLPALSTFKKLCPDSPVTKVFETFIKLYDASYPFEKRLIFLNKLIWNSKSIGGIELEMLMWIAAARWLSRNSAFDLASICLQEYRALSWRLTEGKSQDTLNCCPDLFDRPWYLKRVA